MSLCVGFVVRCPHHDIFHRRVQERVFQRISFELSTHSASYPDHYRHKFPENARAILPFSAAAPVQATHVLSFYKISSPFLLISSTWTSPADLVETPRLG